MQMAGRSVSKRTTITRKSAGVLLFPVAAFLNGGGLSRTEAIEVFADAYDRSGRTMRAQKAEHIGNPLQYSDVVSLWTRDKKFLDKAGNPRLLSMSGRQGFPALIKQTGHKANAQAVLTVLIRYGNVLRVKEGKLSLVKPYFNTADVKNIAFEPHAYFLYDASSTMKRMITKGSKDPAAFWRKTENANLSEAAARRFFEFSRRRSLDFIQEMDDWLEAHANLKNKGRRVGLGVFSVYSKQGM